MKREILPDYKKNDKNRPVDWYPSYPAISEKSTSGSLGAFLPFLIAAVIGVFFWCAGSPAMAIIVWVIAALILASNLFAPVLHVKIQKAFASFGSFVGKIATWTLLTAIFYLAFLPARLIQSLTGRDPLRLNAFKSKQSNWVGRSGGGQRKTFFTHLYFNEEWLKNDGVSLLRLSINCFVFLLVFLLLAEGALRLYGLGSPVLYKSDPDVGYYLAPNQQTSRIGGAEIRTNSFGMRSNEITKQKPAGVYRLMVLGDSVSYGGSNLDQNAIFPTLLQKRLNDVKGKLPDKPQKVEVLNVSANSWGPFNKLGYLQKFGTFDADRVVVVMPLYDLWRLPRPISTMPFFDVSAPPKLALMEVLNFYVLRFKNWVSPSPQNEEYKIRMMEVCSERYRDLIDFLRGKEIPFSFVIVPSAAVASGKAEKPILAKGRKMIEDVLKSEGVVYKAPKTDFLGTEEERQNYFDIMHFNGTGHKLFSEYLSNILLDEVRQ